MSLPQNTLNFSYYFVFTLHFFLLCLAFYGFGHTLWGMAGLLDNYTNFFEIFMFGLFAFAFQFVTHAFIKLSQ